MALLIGGGLIAAVLFMSGSKDEPAIAKTDSVENVVATDEPVAALTPAPVQSIKPTEPNEPTEPTKPNRDEPQPTTATKPNEPNRVNEPQPATPQPTSTQAMTQQKVETPASTSTSTSSTSSADNTIHDTAEQMPSYPGGSGGLMSFISSHLKYPLVAEENGIQGRVIVSFVVEKDGSISNVKISKGVDPSLDREAMRVINSMPRWTPGKIKGQPVRVKYTVPVNFRLQ